MGHDHHEHHAHKHGTKNIRVAFFLNLSFTLIEIVGGLLTNSIAIMSDALHDLGDTMSLGLAWYFQKLSQKGRDEEFTYGYRRYSVIGAVINSIILIVGSIFIILEAIPRIKNPETADSQGMILLAILGVIINGAAVIKLRGGTSINERVVALHMLEDVLGWVAVLVGSIIIHFTDYYVIDAILSLAIAAFILFNVYRNMKSAFNVLLQKVPDNVDVDGLKNHLSSYPLVFGFHDLHIWTLDGEKNVMTVHLVANESITAEQRQNLLKLMKIDMLEYNVHHTTVELDCIIKEDHDIHDEHDND